MFENLSKADLVRMLTAAAGPKGDLIRNFLEHYDLNSLQEASAEQLLEYLTIAFE